MTLVSFAFLIDGVVVAEAASLPTAARPIDGGDWVVDFPTATVEVQQACGWYQVVDVLRPPDTATTIFDRSLLMVDGIPTEQWTERLKTQDELDADVRAANTTTLTADATTNINTLLVTVATLNTLTAMTNTEINQNPAAFIKDVARECKTVARQAIRIARLITGSTLSADSGI